MARPLSILLVVWSLVATPVLCRAGVRLGCCDATIRLSPIPDDHASTDCSRNHCPRPETPASPAEHDEPSPARSDDAPCDSCADVCSPVAKLLDHDASAPCAHTAEPLIVPIAHDNDRFGAFPSGTRAGSPTLPHRPFLPSDIPLLI